MLPQITHSFLLCHHVPPRVFYHRPTCHPPPYPLLSSSPPSIPLPSHPNSGRTTDAKLMAVTGDASDESPRLQRVSQCWAEKLKNQRKKGLSWRGMEGGKEGAEVEMWTEVKECHPLGSEPLIDCSGLIEDLWLSLPTQTHTHTPMHTHAQGCIYAYVRAFSNSHSYMCSPNLRPCLV